MHHKPQARTFGMVVKEVDKDLALFLEMRNREKEKEMKCEEILTSGVDGGRGFDWLLTAPDSPSCLPLYAEKLTSLEGRNKNPDSPTLTSRSSRTTSSEDPSSFRSKSMQPVKPANIKRSGDVNRRPTSSGGRSVPSRPATPTGRPSLPVMSKTSRSSTPNSRATGPSVKTVAPAARSSTPTRVTARPLTPTARSSIPSSSKSVSRPATPTPSARSSTLSTAKSKSRSATPTSAARSSSRLASPIEKPDPTPSASSSQSSKVAAIFKNPVPARGASPTVKSRSSKPPEMSSLPLDAPNLSTSVTKRSNSASRVRPSSTNSRSSLIEVGSTVKSRQQSSPSRVRSAIVHARNSGPAMLSKSYGYGSSGDDVNPVMIGTQMVERVVNMRKLAPPMFDNISSKSSVTSQEISGFGRSLSKKSLDMAIRHMDLTRSIAGDTRPSKVSTSASSVNVRNGPTKSKTATVSNSPPSTKSVVGSELNHNPNSQKLNERRIDNVDTNNGTLSLSPNFQQYP